MTDRRSRGLEEPLEVRLLPQPVYPLLEVRNPVHRTRYLVMLPEFPASSSALCTCTDFARRGLGTCKHIVAADRWLRANPPAPPSGSGGEDRPRASEIWRAVDLRLGECGAGADADIRKLSRPGACLLEAEGSSPSLGDPG